jgi:DNA ligase (NAD+)
MEKILAAGVKIKLERAGGPKPLTGRTFVLTGRLEGLTRDQAKERIEALGGKTADQVSGRVDTLVVGEDPGSKLNKARELKIATLTEKEFLQLIGRE